MASLCLCGIANCEDDDGVLMCPKFLQQQSIEALRHAMATFQAQQQYALVQAQSQVAQAQAQLAQAQAQLAQANLAQLQAQQLAHIQRQNDEYYARVAHENAAKAMIDMSGVNDVPCIAPCVKISKGLQAWKAHARSHYNTFPCNVCNFNVSNNCAATCHFRTCQNFNWMRARAHFESEDERLVLEHKAAFPDCWTNLPHKAF